MTENEIREATGYIYGMIKHPAHNKLSETAIGYLKSMLTLAEEYLKLKGWPEGKEIHIKDDIDYEAQGFNEALRLCKLANLKDYNDMRMFQEKFINADQELRALKKKCGEEA